MAKSRKMCRRPNRLVLRYVEHHVTSFSFLVLQSPSLPVPSLSLSSYILFLSFTRTVKLPFKAKVRVPLRRLSRVSLVSFRFSYFKPGLNLSFLVSQFSNFLWVNLPTREACLILREPPLCYSRATFSFYSG